MMVSKRLVLDANILLRAVFGIRVLSLLQSYEDSVAFYSSEKESLPVTSRTGR